MLAVWLVCWLFSCACMCTPSVVGGGCGCVVGLGISVFGEHAHCRVHVQHRVSVRHLLVVVACAASLKGLTLGVGVCGGLFVLCIVVASVFVLYCFLCFV